MAPNWVRVSSAGRFREGDATERFTDLSKLNLLMVVQF